MVPARARGPLSALVHARNAPGARDCVPQRRDFLTKPSFDFMRFCLATLLRDAVPRSTNAVVAKVALRPFRRPAKA